MSNEDDKDALLTNLKGLLQEKLWGLEKRLALERRNSPYKNLTDAQSRILATLRGEHLSVSEVGRRLGVSRQAVHKIVSQLINEGILSLQSSLDNERDKIIIFTEKGILLKETAKGALTKIDQEIKEKLGKMDFERLKNILVQEWW